jgi:hypothetical protein
MSRQAGSAARLGARRTDVVPGSRHAALVDEGICGTVRFHHRSVREYLTAEWLHELIIDDGSRARIEQLFFRSQYGIEVIVPTMRARLALACHPRRTDPRSRLSCSTRDCFRRRGSEPTTARGPKQDPASSL